MTDTLEANPRAVVGGNNPPAYDAIKAHADDLLTEAYNWADGAVVESQAQDDAVSQLIEDLRLAEKAAEDARKVENKPFDDGKAEVQARYNLYIAPLTNKEPGKIPKAMVALKATLKPWRDKLEAEKRAIAEAARAEAQRIADEAARAVREAQDHDLAAKDAAEALVAQASHAARLAVAAERDKAPGLRKTYTPVLTDARAAVLHYMGRDRQAFLDLVQRLAETDVRNGIHTIPGYEVREGTKL